MMNAREAASFNIKRQLVKLGKAYDKTFEVRLPLTEPRGTYPTIAHEAPTPDITKPIIRKTWTRHDRWSQTVTTTTNAPRAKVKGAIVRSMFGKPLARCEG